MPPSSGWQAQNDGSKTLVTIFQTMQSAAVMEEENHYMGVGSHIHLMAPAYVENTQCKPSE
jgi:hypothetical protein